MSEAFGEVLESEGYESSTEGYEGAGEAGYEGEAAGEAGYEGEGAGEAGYEAYGEDARSDARRRARQRQVTIARQRQAQMRRRPAGGPPPRRAAAAGPAAPTLRAIRADVRAADLDAQAAMIRLRRALDQSTRMAYRNAWVAELSTGASQILDSFEGPLADHDWARALIRGLPDLLLAPGNPGEKQGLERILFDPRFGGSVLIAGIWAVGHFTGHTNGTDSAGPVASVRVFPGTVRVGTGKSATIGAYAYDASNKVVSDAAISWKSIDPNIASVSPTTGPSTTVTGGGAANTTYVRASVGGQVGWVKVRVK